MDAAGMDTYAVEGLTHRQASRCIESVRAIIVPLGGCEPFGSAGELGAGSVCVEAVAGELSARCRILSAPLIPFGCSMPFISFTGAAGVKPRTFVNMLCEILHAYVFQGVDRIFLVSAAPFNKEPVTEVLRRMGAKYPKVKTAFFDINTVLRGGKGADFDRDDELILSVSAYLRGIQRGESSGVDAETADGGVALDRVPPSQTFKEQYRVWKRRGRDPQKFRKICPDGLLLSPDMEISPKQGQIYFERITDAIQKKITAIL
jgi:creatinine amidohydrolase/Fe(II)-dependent formamide hydrolase-like protein